MYSALSVRSNLVRNVGIATAIERKWLFQAKKFHSTTAKPGQYGL